MCGALLGTLRGWLCLHLIPEEGGDRSPLSQPAKTPGSRKPPPPLQPPTLLPQLEPGSQPGPSASTAPCVYGYDVRRWGFRAPGGSLACSGSTSAGQVCALCTALLPLSSLQKYFRRAWQETPSSWVFNWASVAPKQGRIKGSSGGRHEKYSNLSGSCPAPSVSVNAYALQFPACYASKPGGGTRVSP